MPQQEPDVWLEFDMGQMPQQEPDFWFEFDIFVSKMTIVCIEARELLHV